MNTNNKVLVLGLCLFSSCAWGMGKSPSAIEGSIREAQKSIMDHMSATSWTEYKDKDKEDGKEVTKLCLGKRQYGNLEIFKDSTEKCFLSIVNCTVPVRPKFYEKMSKMARNLLKTDEASSAIDHNRKLWQIAHNLVISDRVFGEHLEPVE